jgi:hypothetical protein
LGAQFFENPASLQLSFALGEKIVDAIVGTIRHSEIKISYWKVYKLLKGTTHA